MNWPGTDIHDFRAQKEEKHTDDRPGIPMSSISCPNLAKETTQEENVNSKADDQDHAIFTKVNIYIIFMFLIKS